MTDRGFALFETAVGPCGVAWGRDRLDHRVAELDQLTVGERVVIESNARALGQIGGGPGALDELGKARDVIGLDVGLENRGDPRALGLGLGDVLVDEVIVRVGDGEHARRLAPEDIRGTRGLVIEQLAEVHVASLRSTI